MRQPHRPSHRYSRQRPDRRPIDPRPTDTRQIDTRARGGDSSDPAANQPARRRLAALVILAAMVIAPITGFVACARTAGGIAKPAEQLRELAARMKVAKQTPYTAEYESGGVIVTHVHAPPREAYRAARGVLILGPDKVLLCRPESSTGATNAGNGTAATKDLVSRCEQAPGVDGVTLAQSRAVSAAIEPRFVTAEVVESLLVRAAARPNLAVGRERRTLGGTAADCVGVRAGAAGRLAALSFTACLTAGGVLAGFEGSTGPDGALGSDGTGGNGRVSLLRFTPSAAPDGLNPPAGAILGDGPAAG